MRGTRTPTSGRIRRPALLPLLLLLLAASLPAPASQAQEHGTGMEQVPQPDVERETVRIGGREFEVPAQWRGLRIREKPPGLAELAPVPRRLAKDHGLIYLRRDARDALVAMAAAAEKEGIELKIDSGYRSSQYQKTIIARQLARGKTFADITRFVAPPGYSEHRTGTAVDFSPSNWRFASTPQYRWLTGHAAGFGFSETYPENGHRHPWEPWHWRFRQMGHGRPDHG